MRTDVHVAGKEVLAVVLADVESSLKFPVPTIRDSIIKGGFGYTRVTKDFLLPGNRAEVVHRDVGSRRRKCDAIDLRKLDAETVTQLKAGTFLTVLSLVMCSTMVFSQLQLYRNRQGSRETRMKTSNKSFWLAVWLGHCIQYYNELITA